MPNGGVGNLVLYLGLDLLLFLQAAEEHLLERQEDKGEGGQESHLDDEVNCASQQVVRDGVTGLILLCAYSEDEGADSDEREAVEGYLGVHGDGARVAVEE